MGRVTASGVGDNAVRRFGPILAGALLAGGMLVATAAAHAESTPRATPHTASSAAVPSAAPDRPCVAAVALAGTTATAPDPGACGGTARSLRRALLAEGATEIHGAGPRSLAQVRVGDVIRLDPRGPAAHPRHRERSGIVTAVVIHRDGHRSVRYRGAGGAGQDRALHHRRGTAVSFIALPR